MSVAHLPSGKTEPVWQILDNVMDPEIPVISVVDLGIVRDVREVPGGGLETIITPTYTGCPATARIETDIRQALNEAGFADCALKIELSPPWTSDWITPRGRAQLIAYGIAPPVKSAGKRMLFADAPVITCPRCASENTEQVSEFGSTACKALWRCNACSEPFDHFKCI